MGYPITRGQTAQPLVFLLVLTSDHLTGATGKSPTVTISKNGGAFATPAGAVSEIGNGWYAVAGNATDAATLGPILLHATATACDPVDDCFPVVAYNGQDATALGLSRIDAAVSSRMATYTQPTGFLAATFPVDPAGLAGLSSVHGSGSWATATGFSTLDTAAVRTAVGMASANLDTQIAGILTTALTESYAADGATFSVAQALYEICQLLEEASISGTTMTIKRRDGATTALTLTLNDPVEPTSKTRAT